MKGLILERQEFSRDWIIGSFYYDGDFICYSLERPWLNNKPNESCVPEGEYELKYHRYKGRLDTYALIGETVSHFPSDKQRNLILIHPANQVHELQGCIATGTTKLSGEGRMVKSFDAHKKLINTIISKNIDTITII